MGRNIAAIVLGAAVVLVACNSDGDTKKQVRGLIVDVVARSTSQMESFEVQTPGGQRLRFGVDGDVGITVEHAREHMLTAEPVTVTYRGGSNGPLATLVED